MISVVFYRSWEEGSIVITQRHTVAEAQQFINDLAKIPIPAMQEAIKRKCFHIAKLSD